MSHLVHADQPDSPINDVQAQRFSDMLAQARDQGLRFEVAHLSNSSATLSRPDLAFDLVRPGIAVYGLSPVPALGDMGSGAGDDGEMPCGAGEVGPRGRGCVLRPHLDRATRHQPGTAADRLRRRRFPVAGRSPGGADQRQAAARVGRICMDQFVVDLGPGPLDVAEGDEAILFGPGGSGEPTAQDWADLLGTIHYEVVTSPRGRITRTYREAANR